MKFAVKIWKVEEDVEDDEFVKKKKKFRLTRLDSDKRTDPNRIPIAPINFSERFTPLLLQFADNRMIRFFWFGLLSLTKNPGR
uniref:Uncharacterized protein At2g04370 n=1 Tax=Arabidopsis thaliana TaxID=3702 RepID=Q9SJD2_ARATH|nr:hypothetical protein [Arabidopsis thaliana]AAM15460.1 hypothetical protein [Arabidopsis thaliana]